MTRDDIEALRTSLIALAATLLVAAGVVLYSGAILDDARRVLGEREAQLRQARLRIQRADGEQEMLRRFAVSYRDLERIGFTGEEQRINWLEGLRRANEEARTFGVEYDISAQRPYTHAAEFPAAPLQLHESLMQVRVRLLHEGDLPRFLDALGRTGGGFFTVDRCVLRRLRPGESEASTPSQWSIAAGCDLRWITARVPAEKKK